MKRDLQMVRLSHWEILPFDYFFNLKSHKQHLLHTGLVAVPLHLTGFPSSLSPLSLNNISEYMYTIPSFFIGPPVGVRLGCFHIFAIVGWFILTCTLCSLMQILVGNSIRW